MFELSLFEDVLGLVALGDAALPEIVGDEFEDAVITLVCVFVTETSDCEWVDPEAEGCELAVDADAVGAVVGAVTEEVVDKEAFVPIVVKVGLMFPESPNTFPVISTQITETVCNI